MRAYIEIVSGEFPFRVTIYDGANVVYCAECAGRYVCRQWARRWGYRGRFYQNI